MFFLPQIHRTFKYSKDACFCLGVAKVCIVDADGNETYEGRRCETFSYTGKTLLSIQDYNKKIQDEIRRVKNLKGKLPPWYLDNRPKNEFWEDDTINMLPGVGNKIASSLKAIDINYIRDLKLISEIDLQDVGTMTNDPNLTQQRLRALVNTANTE